MSSQASAGSRRRERAARATGLSLVLHVLALSDIPPMTEYHADGAPVTELGPRPRKMHWEGEVTLRIQAGRRLAGPTER